jgi:hypothetical protein
MVLLDEDSVREKYSFTKTVKLNPINMSLGQNSGRDQIE